MPDQITKPEAEPKNPFDLGDTSTHLNLPVKEERQRNPDGTFAPVPTEPIQPEAPVAPVADPLRASMIRDAVALGFEPEELADMSSAAIFRTLQITMRQQLESTRELSRARTLINAEVRQPPPPDDLDLGVNPDGSPVTEDQVHPSLLIHMRKTKELEAKLAQREQADVQRNFMDTTDVLDDIFESLGPDYERFVGKGSSVDLSKSGDAGLRRRIAILGEVGINLAAQAITPTQARRAAGKIKLAAEFLYGPSLKGTPAASPYAEPQQSSQPRANGRRITPEQWDEAAVAVPTSRPPAELPKGDERAIRNLEQKMADQRRAGGRQSDAEIMMGMFKGGSTAVGS